MTPSKARYLPPFIKHNLNTILSPFNHIQNAHSSCCNKLEKSILKNEDSDRHKIKKSIVLYHSYLKIVFFVIIPFFHQTSFILESFIQILLSMCHILVLKEKRYWLIGNFTFLFAIISPLLQLYTKNEPLITINLILSNQYMLFLFPANSVFDKIYIPIMILFTRNLQIQSNDHMSLWWNVIEPSNGNNTCSWVLVCLFHYFTAKNLIISYRNALINNMEIQNELKKTLNLLGETNQELKEAVHSRELYIASVSHELRNPLSSLIGNIELMKAEATGEKLLKALDTCKLCSDVLLDQINKILDTAKINADRLELHYLPHNFYNLIEKIWKISAISIQQKKLNGEIRISSNFPKYIKIDSHRLTQIFLNLIGNATKFCRNGFVHVRISWSQGNTIETVEKQEENSQMALDWQKIGSPSSLLVSLASQKRSGYVYQSFEEFHNVNERSFTMENFLQRNIRPKFLTQIASFSDYISATVDDVSIENKFGSSTHFYLNQRGVVKIEVIDSGCGMTPKVIDNLFQPFKQADSSITSHFGGTGLGLYITKMIVEKMGGKIHVKSKLGVGSTFRVLIPVESVSQNEFLEETLG